MINVQSPRGGHSLPGRRSAYYSVSPVPGVHAGILVPCAPINFFGTHFILTTYLRK